MGSSFSARRTQLLEKHLDANSRILILGASGWFGRTILDLAAKSRIQTLGIASNTRSIQIGDTTQNVFEWDFELISAFKPTIVIDCAFLTPDRMETIGEEAYVAINMKLISDFINSCMVNTVRSAITISSGAVGKDTEKLNQGNPKKIYGELKRFSEDKLIELASQRKINTVVARVWSVSGSFVIEPSKYAFSDLITQAKKSKAIVNANHHVWRRYCSAADFLTVALALSSQKGNHILESGGELIELHQLSNQINSQLKPDLNNVPKYATDKSEEFYCSDGKNWVEVCQRLNFLPLSLAEQISEVSLGMKL